MNSLREYRDQYKREALIRKEKAQKEKLPRSSPPVSESGFYSTASEINEEDSISQFCFFAILLASRKTGKRPTLDAKPQVLLSLIETL